MLTFSGSSERPVTPSKIDISLKTLAEQFKTLPDNVKDHIIPRKTLRQDIADLRRTETPEETGKQIARVHMLNHYLQHSRKGLGERVKALPDDLGEQIMPASILIRDILAMRHPETSEDAAKQLVRFRFLESRVKSMPQNRQTALLCSALEKNHPAFFHFLFKNTPAPDMPALLDTAVLERNNEAFQELLHRTSVPNIPASAMRALLHTAVLARNNEAFQELFHRTPVPIPASAMGALLHTAVVARNDEAFQELLHRTPFPIPLQKLNETLKCLARYGEPEKLEQLLARQPETDRPSAEQLEKFRNLAQEEADYQITRSQLPDFPVRRIIYPLHLAQEQDQAIRAISQLPDFPRRRIAYRLND